MPEPPDFDDSASFAINTPVRSPLERRIEALEKAQQRRAGALWFASILSGLLVPGILAGFAWTWSINGDVIRHEGMIARNAEAHVAHIRRPGHDGTVERTSQNAERIRALEQRADETRTSLREIGEKLDDILERLPRRRR